VNTPITSEKGHTMSNETVKPNVEPTAEVISKMAQTLRGRADELDRLATRMRETGNIDYASEAISVYVGMVGELRLDLLVARPIRELESAGR
jgi:hypothetical protein